MGTEASSAAGWPFHSPMSLNGTNTKVLLVILYLVSKMGSKTNMKMIRNITRFRTTRNRRKEK